MNFPTSLKDLVATGESLVYVEDLSGRKGFLQSIHPLVKMIVTVFMISASLFVTWLPHLLALCVIPLVLAVLSKVPLKKFVVRTTLFMPLFAAIISLPTLFLTIGSPLLSANIGGFTLSITVEGLQRFLVFTVRVWFCVSSLTLLTLTTGFDKILKLLSSIKVPSLIIQLFSLTYRYLFVSLDEVQKVLTAKEARTYVNRRTVSLESLKRSGAVLSMLFIRTYERSERVYMAMKSRGFEIDNTRKSSIPALHSRDLLFAVPTIVAFGLPAILAVL
jgi:cobalt/nickel transport system permease protein